MQIACDVIPAILNQRGEGVDYILALFISTLRYTVVVMKYPFLPLNGLTPNKALFFGMPSRPEIPPSRLSWKETEEKSKSRDSRVCFCNSVTCAKSNLRAGNCCLSKICAHKIRNCVPQCSFHSVLEN